MELLLVIVIGIYIYKKIKHMKMIKEKQQEIHLENIKRFREENKKEDKKITKGIKNNIEKFIKTKETKEIKQHYKKNLYLTTKTELEMYKILLEICTKYNLILFTQVVLYEIVQVNEKPFTREHAKYFNKICSKSIDFVIADKETTRIRLCIELDDPTHKKKKRIQRDEFIDKLFEDLQIDLLRIKTCNEYNINQIESKIRSTCTDIYY